MLRFLALVALGLACTPAFAETDAEFCKGFQKCLDGLTNCHNKGMRSGWHDWGMTSEQLIEQQRTRCDQDQKDCNKTKGADPEQCAEAHKHCREGIKSCSTDGDTQKACDNVDESTCVSYVKSLYGPHDDFSHSFYIKEEAEKDTDSDEVKAKKRALNEDAKKKKALLAGIYKQLSNLGCDCPDPEKFTVANDYNRKCDCSTCYGDVESAMFDDLDLALNNAVAIPINRTLGAIVEKTSSCGSTEPGASMCIANNIRGLPGRPEAAAAAEDYCKDASDKDNCKTATMAQISAQSQNAATFIATKVASRTFSANNMIVYCNKSPDDLDTIFRKHIADLHFQWAGAPFNGATPPPPPVAADSSKLGFGAKPKGPSGDGSPEDIYDEPQGGSVIIQANGQGKSGTGQGGGGRDPATTGKGAGGTNPDSDEVVTSSGAPLKENGLPKCAANDDVAKALGIKVCDPKKPHCTSDPKLKNDKLPLCDEPECTTDPAIMVQGKLLLCKCTSNKTLANEKMPYCEPGNAKCTSDPAKVHAPELPLCNTPKKECSKDPDKIAAGATKCPDDAGKGDGDDENTQVGDPNSDETEPRDPLKKLCVTKAIEGLDVPECPPKLGEGGTGDKVGSGKGDKPGKGGGTGGKGGHGKGKGRGDANGSSKTTGAGYWPYGNTAGLVPFPVKIPLLPVVGSDEHYVPPSNCGKGSNNDCEKGQSDASPEAATGDLGPIAERDQDIQLRVDAAAALLERLSAQYASIMAHTKGIDVSDLAARCKVPDGYEKFDLPSVIKGTGAAVAEIPEDKKVPKAIDLPPSLEQAELRRKYHMELINAARALNYLDTDIQTLKSDFNETPEKWESAWPSWAPCRSLIQVADGIREMNAGMDMAPKCNIIDRFAEWAVSRQVDENGQRLQVCTDNDNGNPSAADKLVSTWLRDAEDSDPAAKAQPQDGKDIHFTQLDGTTTLPEVKDDASSRFGDSDGRSIDSRLPPPKNLLILKSCDSSGHCSFNKLCKDDACTLKQSRISMLMQQRLTLLGQFPELAGPLNELESDGGKKKMFYQLFSNGRPENAGARADKRDLAALTKLGKFNNQALDDLGNAIEELCAHPESAGLYALSDPAIKNKLLDCSSKATVKYKEGSTAAEAIAESAKRCGRMHKNETRICVTVYDMNNRDAMLVGDGGGTCVTQREAHIVGTLITGRLPTSLGSNDCVNPDDKNYVPTTALKDKNAKYMAAFGQIMDIQGCVGLVKGIGGLAKAVGNFSIKAAPKVLADAGINFIKSTLSPTNIITTAAMTLPTAVDQGWFGNYNGAKIAKGNCWGGMMTADECTTVLAQASDFKSGVKSAISDAVIGGLFFSSIEAIHGGGHAVNEKTTKLVKSLNEVEARYKEGKTTIEEVKKARGALADHMETQIANTIGLSKKKFEKMGFDESDYVQMGKDAVAAEAEGKLAAGKDALTSSDEKHPGKRAQSVSDAVDTWRKLAFLADIKNGAENLEMSKIPEFIRKAREAIAKLRERGAISPKEAEKFQKHLADLESFMDKRVDAALKAMEVNPKEYIGKSREEKLALLEKKATELEAQKALAEKTPTSDSLNIRISGVSGQIAKAKAENRDDDVAALEQQKRVLEAEQTMVANTEGSADSFPKNIEDATSRPDPSIAPPTEKESGPEIEIGLESTDPDDAIEPGTKISYDDGGTRRTLKFVGTEEGGTFLFVDESGKEVRVAKADAAKYFDKNASVTPPDVDSDTPQESIDRKISASHALYADFVNDAVPKGTELEFSSYSNVKKQNVPRKLRYLGKDEQFLVFRDENGKMIRFQNEYDLCRRLSAAVSPVKLYAPKGSPPEVVAYFDFVEKKRQSLLDDTPEGHKALADATVQYLASRGIKARSEPSTNYSGHFLVIIDPPLDDFKQPDLTNYRKQPTLVRMALAARAKHRANLAFDTAKLSGGGYFSTGTRTMVVSFVDDMPRPGEKVTKQFGGTGWHERYHAISHKSTTDADLALIEREAAEIDPDESNRLKMTIGRRPEAVYEVVSNDGDKIVLQDMSTHETVEMSVDDFRKTPRRADTTFPIRTDLPIQVGIIGNEDGFTFDQYRKTYGKNYVAEEFHAFEKSSWKAVGDAKKMLEACSAGGACDPLRLKAVVDRATNRVLATRDHLKATTGVLEEAIDALKSGKIKPKDIKKLKNASVLNMEITLPSGRKIRFSDTAINVRQPDVTIDSSRNPAVIADELNKLLAQAKEDAKTVDGDAKALTDAHAKYAQTAGKNAVRLSSMDLPAQRELPLTPWRRDGIDVVENPHSVDLQPTSPAAVEQQVVAQVKASGSWKEKHKALSKNNNDPMPAGFIQNDDLSQNDAVSPAIPLDVKFSKNSKLADRFGLGRDPPTASANGHYNVRVTDASGHPRDVKVVWHPNQGSEAPWFIGEIPSDKTRAGRKGTYSVSLAIPPDKIGTEMTGALTEAQRNNAFMFHLCGVAALCTRKDRFIVYFDSESDAKQFAGTMDKKLAQYPANSSPTLAKWGNGHVGFGFNPMVEDGHQISHSVNLAMAEAEGEELGRRVCAGGDAACLKAARENRFNARGLDANSGMPIAKSDVPFDPKVKLADSRTAIDPLAKTDPGPAGPRGPPQNAPLPATAVAPTPPGGAPAPFRVPNSIDPNAPPPLKGGTLSTLRDSKMGPDIKTATYTLPNGENVEVWVKPHVRNEVDKTQKARRLVDKLNLTSIGVPRAEVVIVDGVPQLMTEHVDGVPIDSDEGKKLVSRNEWEKFKKEFLDLRRSGVSHGDLNPGNVLVTNQGGKLKFNLIDWDGRTEQGISTDDSVLLAKTDDRNLRVIDRELFPIRILDAKSDGWPAQSRPTISGPWVNPDSGIAFQAKPLVLDDPYYSGKDWGKYQFARDAATTLGKKVPDMTREELLPPGYDFKPPATVEISKGPDTFAIKLPELTSEERFGATLGVGLSPERNATKIGAGGFSDTFVAHTEMPASLVDRISKMTDPTGKEQEAARKEWALAHIIPADDPTVVKIKRPFPDKQGGFKATVEGMRRDVFVYDVAKQLLEDSSGGSRLNVDGKPILRVAKTYFNETDINALRVRQEFVAGTSAFDLQNALNVVNDPTKFKSDVINWAKQTLADTGISPEELQKKIWSMEQFYRDSHSTVLQAMKDNKMMQPLNGIRPIGLDYNHGVNVMWSKKEQMFVMFDW